MNRLDRFAGGLSREDVCNVLASNARPDPPSLQLLFAAAPVLHAEPLTARLLAYHPDLANAEVEVVAVTDISGSESIDSHEGPPATALGLASWGTHAIQIVSFDQPMPGYAIDGCLQAALLPPEVKEDARCHSAHVLLYYAGSDENPLEQLVALAAVAGVLAEYGAIVTLNEEARTAILSTDLLPDADGEDMLTVLRTLPLTYLYCGFVKMLLSDVPGVWMRTFAAHRFKLPNLARHAKSHDEGQATFRLFSGLLAYLQQTGFQFEIGEVIRIDDDTLMSVREPHESEWWLESPGPLWVLIDAEAQP